MATVALTVNERSRSIEIDPTTPLLWVLRDSLGLTGTKFGCGIAQCGACTVILEGNAVRSCVTPVSRALGKRVTTIEGLSQGSNHPLRRAWLSEQVPQCGYCQSGQIMSAAVLLAKIPKPTDQDIDRAMAGQHLPVRHLSADPASHPSRSDGRRTRHSFLAAGRGRARAIICG